ncbi:MAG: hypothetical protein K2X03_19555 [Bryobacteraceae bacterium]|nr:hypothetical protein [Bryobacteraceae bacterium]
MLLNNNQGNYRFWKGIAPYSAGAIASPGFEIVHVRFAQPVPLAEGFTRVRAEVHAAGRPIHALCAMALRSPAPFSFAGFNDFNATYVHTLVEWGLLVDGLNPVARTNIAPALQPPPEPSVYSFAYTVPSSAAAPTFIVAGAGELPEGSLSPDDVVRKGDLSPEGLREKIRFVMGLMSGRLQGLGVGWSQVTTANVYTVHPICAEVEKEIAPWAANHGFTWYYSRPPIETIEYEMDLRGVRREVVL